MDKHLDSTATRMSTLQRQERPARDGVTAVVEGHLLHVQDGFDVAIYTRNGDCWVAELHHDHASLVEATTWFRFHARPLRYAHAQRVGALETATALTPAALAQIERLHREAERTAPCAVVAALVIAIRRWIGLATSRNRTSAPRRAEDLG
jgi:hypothetical protein